MIFFKAAFIRQFLGGEIVTKGNTTQVSAGGFGFTAFREAVFCAAVPLLILFDGLAMTHQTKQGSKKTSNLFRILMGLTQNECCGRMLEVSPLARRDDIAIAETSSRLSPRPIGRRCIARQLGGGRKRAILIAANGFNDGSSSATLTGTVDSSGNGAARMRFDWQVLLMSVQ